VFALGALLLAVYALRLLRNPGAKRAPRISAPTKPVMAP